MAYVKGTDISGLSRFFLKRVANGKIEIHNSLRSVLSYDVLSTMLAEAKQDFVSAEGKVIRDMPQAEIFVMTKKIDGVKYIIGLSEIRIGNLVVQLGAAALAGTAAIAATGVIVNVHMYQKLRVCRTL